jgi:transcriptional regulator with XRE-family HTH domain
MGRAPRPIPKRLGFKLRAIRNELGLSQQQMIKRLDYSEAHIHRSHVSEYERGLREPFLGVLLRYARLIEGVTVEMLIDDKMELPKKGMLRTFTRFAEDPKYADKVRTELFRSPK